MLNLLRFRPGGRACCQEYARQLAAAFLPRYDAWVIYAGDGSTAQASGQGHAWDAVLLVRYLSREAFSQRAADLSTSRSRTCAPGALTETVLQATVPWQAPPSADAARGPGAGQPRRIMAEPGESARGTRGRS